MNYVSKQTITGFTLVELLATIVVISMLAGIAWPNYQRHVLKAHRSEGMSALNNLLQAQEDFYLDNRAYTTDLTDLGYSSSTNVATDNGRYQLSASTCTTQTQLTQCIQLTATAQGKQTGDNNGNSGNLTLNSLGEKSGWE